MIVPYILNVGIMLMGSLCFYKLFLQRQTFYQLNRFVLLGCLLLSFTLPLIRIPSELSLVKNEEAVSKPSARVEQQPTLPPSSRLTPGDAKTEAAQTNRENVSSTISLSQVGTWALYLYWFGVVVFALNFLLQLTTLMYRAYTSPIIRDGKFRLVEVTGNKAPCSFANNIFINPSLYDWDTYRQILLHEKIHVQQRHTIDLLLAEAMLIFQWFNPFAWLYRKEVEANLEFLTDENVLLDKDIEPASYQLSLVKVSAPQFPMHLTTNYNQSLLKKRVMMMNAKKSNIHTAWKYTFLLPLFVLLMSVFNEPIAQTGTAQLKGAERSDFSGGWTATLEKDRLFVALENKKVPNDSVTIYFSLAEIKDFATGKQINFSVVREAGTLQFKGSLFDGKGIGTFRFIPAANFSEQMKKENLVVTEAEQVNFFLTNVTSSYVQMLKKQGYSQLKKEEVARLAEFGVGRKESVKEEVPVPPPVDDNPLSQMINFKSVGITEEYIQGFKQAGYTNIPPGTLINFKSVGVTPEYLKSFEAAGFKDIPFSTIVNFKSVGVTPEYIKSFQQSGYTDVSYTTIVNLKAAGINPPGK